ncbi:MAG: DUF4296 domain-containing protein [Bacteroidetes bacterium]|nr:DUF4296 domain-containing protein [Bacteroidota bacterium]
MKHYRIVTLIFLIVFSSCSYFEKHSTCEDIMEKEKFVAVMTDVYMIEAYFEIVHISSDALQDSIAIYYNSLFREHDITREQLINAINCYVLERETINKIHDDVINSLILMEEKTTED